RSVEANPPLAEQGFQEAQALGRDRVLGWRERPPDRGGFGDRLVLDGERLDDDGPFVPYVVERRGDLRPGDLIRTGRAPVAAARMEVGHVAAAGTDGGGRIVLFDVHVERVEEDS